MKKFWWIIPVALVVILAIASGILILIGVFSNSQMVTCSGVTILDNEVNENSMNYHGYYLNFPAVEAEMSNHIDEIEAICTGDFKEAFEMDGDRYIIFDDKNKKTALVISDTDIMACKDVRYSIRYKKNTKGNVPYFDYDKNSAKIITYAFPD